MLKNILGVVFLLILIFIIARVWQGGINGLEFLYGLFWILILTISYLGFSIYSLFKKKYLDAFLSFFAWNFLVLGPFHATWIVTVYLNISG